MDVAKHGDRATLYSMGAWLLEADRLSVDLHRKHKPNQAAIESYIEKCA